MFALTLKSVCVLLGLSCGFLERLSEVALESPATATCRCLSTEPCWPSDAAFAELESQLSGQLIYPAPAAKPCYDAPESQKCQTAKSHWYDGAWRADNPGATQITNFAAYTAPNGSVQACYLDTTLGYPCEWGSVSSVGVDARTRKDVQLAVKFAAKYNLRVVVKNTGHDFLGRSAARGSFLIWTHNLKEIKYSSGLKLGDDGPIYYDVMHLDAGVQWQEAYDFAFARGRDIVGGLSAGGTVGAIGGWLQGGGHSILSPQHGLGVDNVIEMVVVTASGEVVDANADCNADLFWALRGGGGGTWGVVVRAIIQTHAPQPLVAATFVAAINVTLPRAQVAASPTLHVLFSELVRMTPLLADVGWAGYASVQASDDLAHAALTLTYIAPAGAQPTAVPFMEQFFVFARQLALKASDDDGRLSVLATTFTPYPSFGVWEAAHFRGRTGQVGKNVEMGSRLLPQSLLMQDFRAVADALLDLGLPYIGFYTVAGKAATKPEPDTTAVHPAWRKALVHAVFGASWPDGSSPEVGINAVRDKIKKGEAALRKMTPGGGAYFNEASLYQADFKSDFFGPHYDRLRAIKKKYDPNDLFLVPSGVGSEDWDADLHCRV